MMVTNAARFGTEKALEPLRRVNAAGTHLLSLINEVLDLSKIEAGKLELNPEPVNLAPLIDEVIGTAGQLAEKNENRVIVEAQENLGVLNADSMRLKQILLNLLSNACKFTKEGEVALRVRNVADGRDWVELAVADTGIGLTARRMAAFPDLPTCQDIGYKEVIYILWNGVFAPVKTPAQAQETLRSAIKEFMSNPEVLDRFRKGGTELGYLDGPDFAKFLEADTARLLSVARKIKLSS
jgi:hypothetical protein